MKTFYTIFPLLENQHLLKDVGLIPYYFYLKGYSSYIVCFEKNDNFSYLKKYNAGLKLIFISNDENYILGKYLSKSLKKFLKFNSKKIDILNLFHLTNETIKICILYKLKNHRGKIYIKADANVDFLKNDFTNINIKKKFKIFIYKIVLKYFVNILTVENNESYNFLKKIFKISEKKLRLLPNGIHTLLLNTIKNDLHKENIIISVGRVGSEQKNYEILFEVVKNIKQFKDWKIIIIGNITNVFQQKLEEFYNEFPMYKNILIFTGEIEDKNTLYEFYMKSKFYLCTSKWEGFSLSLLDSLYFGLKIISTPISSISEISNNYKFVNIYKNNVELKCILEDIINDKIKNDMQNQIQNYSKNFSWDKNINNLLSWLNNGY